MSVTLIALKYSGWRIILPLLYFGLADSNKTRLLIRQ